VNLARLCFLFGEKAQVSLFEVLSLFALEFSEGFFF
jgi:hypothetical protein